MSQFWIGRVTGNPRMVPTAVAAVGVLALDAVTPLGLDVWLFQVVLVWITAFWANRREIIMVSAMCAVFVVVGFWFSPRTRPEMWMDASNLLFCLFMIAAIAHTCVRRRAAEEEHRIASQRLAQSQEEVRVLSGCLPICAWCKKIRNEAGAWEQLESYIRSHSDADFTHGVCQECAARMLEETAVR